MDVSMAFLFEIFMQWHFDGFSRLDKVGKDEQ